MEKSCKTCKFNEKSVITANHGTMDGYCIAPRPNGTSAAYMHGVPLTTVGNDDWLAARCPCYERKDKITCGDCIHCGPSNGGVSQCTYDPVDDLPNWHISKTVPTYANTNCKCFRSK